MAVILSVKNVPYNLAERLRMRAKRHHRSLQGGLMVILEEAAGLSSLSIGDAGKHLNTLGLRTDDESAAWLRDLRGAS